MNILVLTPDKVGSTLLQRLITVYMQVHNYGKPVINLHELTLGIEEVYSQIYNRIVLMRSPVKKLGYHQTLPEIVNLLENNDHYKVCRVAHYHLNVRQDSIADQTEFFQYLNDNFFVISARRNNLFEHAISWGIFQYTKRLNVYSHEEKYDYFYNIYKEGITIQPEVMVRQLNSYKDYLDWTEKYFTIGNYFDYEKDIKNIEDYVLNLSIFPPGEKKTWKDIFGIQFNDWNRCHKLLGEADHDYTKMLQLSYDEKTTGSALVTKHLKNGLSKIDDDFLKDNVVSYQNTNEQIFSLVNRGVLPGPIPIKLQTLKEKQKIIKNFKECVDTYNKWVEQKQMGEPYSLEDIEAKAQLELSYWYKEVPAILQSDSQTKFQEINPEIYVKRSSLN